MILTLGLKGKKQMTGCALILVRICERDLYDILHELFKEGNITVSPGCREQLSVLCYFTIPVVDVPRGATKLPSAKYRSSEKEAEATLQ